MCEILSWLIKWKSASSRSLNLSSLSRRRLPCRHSAECEASPITIIRMCVLCTFEYNVQNNYISIAKHVERKEWKKKRNTKIL